MNDDRKGYALSNPLTVFLDKPAEDFQRKDFLRVITTMDIERITFHYTALDGRLKELKLPISSRQAEVVLAEGERLDGSSLFKGIVDTENSDLYVVPVYKSAFLNPFDSGSLDFICRYLTKEGRPAGFAPDNILEAAVRSFRSHTGLDFRALGELEFFLVSPGDSETFRLDRQQGYHEAAPFIKSGGIINEMIRYIEQITGAVKYAHSEVGSIDCIESEKPELQGKRAEQMEVEFITKPVVDMADALVLSRWIIRNVAFKHGCDVTFAPKLEKGVAGNGLHFHLELHKEGRNIMRTHDGELSEEALRLIGGLCHYADSLTSFGNTVASSYMRLVPAQEAPTKIFWSDMNRNALIRVPLAWKNIHNLAARVNAGPEPEPERKPHGQTVELRSPDGSALIHPLLAGIVMAGEWGLTDESSLDLAKTYYAGSEQSEKGKRARSFPLLPSSCVESSRRLLAKRELYERNGVFPAIILEYVARLLQAENDEMMNRTLDELPLSDRLREIRKIMHRSLHRH